MTQKKHRLPCKQWWVPMARCVYTQEHTLADNSDAMTGTCGTPERADPTQEAAEGEDLRWRLLAG